MARDTSKLRDILFDELEELRKGGDSRRGMAVARLSQQIISTAKVEMEFHRLAAKAREAGEELRLGSMDLGGRAERAVVNGQKEVLTHQPKDEGGNRSD